MSNSMLPRSRRAKPSMGQPDHVDAWLISYADLITLLFMVFVIFVAVSQHKPNTSKAVTHGEQEHPFLQKRSGTLELGTKFDEAYRAIAGVIESNAADQHIAVEKNYHGIAIDLSVIRFFAPGSADIPDDQLPVLQDMARALQKNMPKDSLIEIEGHTDDAPPSGSPFSNDWELSAMRAARIAAVLAKEGVDPAKLRATGYAGAQPLVPNKDVAGHGITRNQERNQRIIIRLEAMPEAPDGGEQAENH